MSLLTKEILNSLEDYVDNSISFEDAEESVNHLHQIVLDVEEKVELQEPQESMQRIPLFEPDDEHWKVPAPRFKYRVRSARSRSPPET